MTQNHYTPSLTELQEKLQELDLPFSEHFARALVALLTARKVSLHEIAGLMPGEQSHDANRQQLRRGLDHKKLQSRVWSRAIATLLPRGSWILALDRTEWRRGKTKINLLVLAVVIHGCAVPLLWTVLPSGGNSDTSERIALMQEFLDLFGPARWRFLTADREFIGQKWIAYLLEKKLGFRIRIKAGEFLTTSEGRCLRGGEMFAFRSCSCKKKRVKLWGLEVFVGGKRLRDGTLLIVISSKYVNDSIQSILSDYRLRWKIETLFQSLKGRGFDMESCRLSQEERLSGWFGFLALGLCWCLKVGAVLDEVFPLPLKNHGRRSVSIFQRGLRELRCQLCRLAGRRGELTVQVLFQEFKPVS